MPYVARIDYTRHFFIPPVSAGRYPQKAALKWCILSLYIRVLVIPVTKIMKKIFLYVIGSLLLLGVVYYAVGSFLWPQYVAVYMNTGDLYFGSLTRFPHVVLRDVWFMQKDSSSGELSAQQFSKVIWEPEGDLYLNNSQIVWVAHLKKGTQLYAALVSGAFLNQQNVPSQTASAEGKLPVISPSAPDASQ